MRPNEAETAVHVCHCLGDMAVRIRKALVSLWFNVRVCHLLLLLETNTCTNARSEWVVGFVLSIDFT